jgi:Ankyrin repeats (3 copies)
MDWVDDSKYTYKPKKILNRLTDKEYLLGIIGGCYTVFESNGTFDRCVQLEPYRTLTNKILQFHADQIISSLSNEDIQRAASWFLDEYKQVCCRPDEEKYANIMCAACRDGHIHIVKFASQYITANNFDSMCLYYASKNGHFEIVQWLSPFPIFNTAYELNYSLYTACKNGHLEIAKWLVAHGADIHFQKPRIAYVSCQRGHLEIVKWLVAFGVVDIDQIFICAAYEGHLEIFKWLCSQHDITKYIPQLTKKYDHVHIPQHIANWIRENYHIDI